MLANLDFNNTQIAFDSLSDAELRKAQVLFKTFGSRLLMETGPKLVSFAFKLGLPISPVVKATVFDQFCGGETIEKCSKTITKLAAKGVGSILDYSVEGMQREDDFERNCKEILRTIQFAKTNHNVPFCVFKMTGIARFRLLEKLAREDKMARSEWEEYDRINERLTRICQSAADAGVPILIDAEESWIQDPIDAMATQMMMTFNRERAIVYNTLQMYRHDRLEYMRQSHGNAVESGFKLGFKLVRGAYMEKERERAAEHGYEDPIQPSKAATDGAFDDALRFCVEHVDTIAIVSGSHNEDSAYLLADLMRDAGLAPNDSRIAFSQLYGMSDHITFNLAHGGYNVSKYVPYGPVKYVMPYLIRRAEENSSVAGQSSRELQLIENELKRRK